MPRTISPLARRLTSLSAGLLLALALAESVLRLAGPSLAAPRLPLKYDVAAIDRLASGQSYLTFDADLGWRPTPDVDLVFELTHFVQNHDGLRANRIYTPIPPANVRRIAAYGDSFTYCVDVDLSACWTTRIEQRLAGSEVLNFGVTGYGPDQAWLRYQQGGAGWRPCAVLIGHMLENINRVISRFRPFLLQTTDEPLAKPRFVLDGDRLALLPMPLRQASDLALVKDPIWVETNLGPGDGWYFPGTFVANPFDWLELVRLGRTAAYRGGRQGIMHRSTNWAEYMYQPGTEAFDITAEVLTEFASQVRADGAAPVVLIFPAKTQIAAQANGAPKAHAPLLETLDQRGIAVVDLTEPLADEARRSSVGDVIGMHYRERGNAVVARAISEQLPPLIGPSCRPA